MGRPKGRPRKVVSEPVEIEDVMGVEPGEDPGEDTPDEIEEEQPEVEPQEEETKSLPPPVARPANRMRPRKSDPWSARAAAEAAGCKMTLDLSMFQVFDGSIYYGRSDDRITVLASGEIGISHKIAKDIADGTKVEFLLNNAGTILVMRESPKGIPLHRRNGTKNSEAKAAACAALTSALQKLGKPLPARYVTEWNEELHAWVGRLLEAEEKGA